MPESVVACMKMLENVLKAQEMTEKKCYIRKSNEIKIKYLSSSRECCNKQVFTTL